jgi:hypothetical protein
MHAVSLGHLDSRPFWLGLKPGRKLVTSPRLAFMVLHFMAKSNKVLPKKARGRPATGRDPVTAIRLSAEMRETVDRWADRQSEKPTRSEAIRRLVEIGLLTSTNSADLRYQAKASDSATKAKKLAGELGLKAKK